MLFTLFTIFVISAIALLYVKVKYYPNITNTCVSTIVEANTSSKVINELTESKLINTKENITTTNEQNIMNNPVNDNQINENIMEENTFDIISAKKETQEAISMKNIQEAVTITKFDCQIPSLIVNEIPKSLSEIESPQIPTTFSESIVYDKVETDTFEKTTVKTEKISMGRGFNFRQNKSKTIIENISNTPNLQGSAIATTTTAIAEKITTNKGFNFRSNKSKIESLLSSSNVCDKTSNEAQFSHAQSLPVIMDSSPNTIDDNNKNTSCLMNNTTITNVIIYQEQTFEKEKSNDKIKNYTLFDCSNKENQAENTNIEVKPKSKGFNFKNPKMKSENLSKSNTPEKNCSISSIVTTTNPLMLTSTTNEPKIENPFKSQAINNSSFTEMNLEDKPIEKKTQVKGFNFRNNNSKIKQEQREFIDQTLFIIPKKMYVDE